MNLNLLSDKELELSIVNTRDGERKDVLKILYYLQEIDTRKSYRESGYSSIFDFCVRKLSYSEGSAYKRIQAAKALKDNPLISKSYLSGKVSLTTLATSYKSMKEGAISLKEIEGKSKKEVLTLVKAPEEVKTLKERVRRVKFKGENVGSNLMLFNKESKPVKNTEELHEDERIEITFSLTKEEFKTLEKAKRKLSHVLKEKGSQNKEVFMLLVNRFLKPRNIKGRAARIDTRRIPEGVKREVFERDQGACSFVAPDGTKCLENTFLHYDHIVPFSLGGKSEAKNLRLRCPQHNLLYAEEVYGKDYIEKTLRSRIYRNHSTSLDKVESSLKKSEKHPRVFHLKK